MRSKLSLGSALTLCSAGTVLAAPRGNTLSARKSSRPDNHTLNVERADAVKAAFQVAWDGYKQFAFPHDELHPVSNGFGNSRNGWGASAIDAFSTALLMQNKDVVNTILEYIPTIDFSTTSADSTEISLFETTIRYLGGLVSGYDLLTGPLANLASNKTLVDTVLAQAKNLADNLSFAFDTPTGIPSNNLFFHPSRTDGSTTNGLATIGTLVLEWTRLSDLTGNATYGELSQKGESFLLNPQPASSEPFPGLVGTNVDINTGLFQDASGGWNGGDDSFYEYLLKMYVYDSTRFASYKDRWIAAADSTIANLTSHPSSRPDLTFLAQYSGTDLFYSSGHLACFDGGSFLLGGSVLNEQKYIDYGLELVAGCHDTYASTATHIGPEGFNWVTDGPLGNNQPVPADQQAFYNTTGYFITNGNYILRPEVIESYYYAYRVTGDQMYRDWAWDAFVAINATTRTGSGFSEIKDVNVAGGGGFFDNQDSFLFAEVMKYSYLIHAPDNIWQVNHNGQNQYVFNTEAHPVKVAGPSI
ncbi:glycoside hydrolase [Xylogone sp. PMI_703]|nr:glycoside hydrolase [Xylogone sp. PMI_703]